MGEWWASLTNPEQVFFLIAFVSTGILFIQLILNLIGAGMDADVEIDASDGGMDIEHTSGLGLLSIRSVMAFFVGFGWAGAAVLREGRPLYAAVIAAMVVGSIFLYVVFWVMKVLYGLSESGNIDINRAVGQSGSVYIPIPGKGKGSGQVQVQVQGRLRELTAMTDQDESLATGTPIKVIKIISGDTAVVRRLKL